MDVALSFASAAQGFISQQFNENSFVNKNERPLVSLAPRTGNWTHTQAPKDLPDFKSTEHSSRRKRGRSQHPEKCFIESTKIWLAQQIFSFKYESMEILFEITKEILLIFFFFLQFQQKTFCIDSKKHGIAN